MSITDPRPTVEERYSVATSAKSLRCDTREGAPTSSADILTASGFSKGVLGTALMRLRSEWDGTPKPSRPEESQILLMASKLPAEIVVDGKTVTRTEKELVALSRFEANGWYRAEMQLVALRLKSLGVVKARMQAWAEEHQAKNPERFAQGIISYWLNSVCPACHGRGKQVIDGTPVLGDDCRVCDGTGKQRAPMGELGAKALSVMDESVFTAESDMRNALKKH